MKTRTFLYYTLGVFHVYPAYCLCAKRTPLRRKSPLCAGRHFRKEKSTLRLTVVSSLYPSRKKKIESLVRLCREAEGIRLSFPYSDASFYAFFKENAGIPAAAAFTDLGEQTFECCAFVRPDLRGRGLFSRLLSAGLSKLPPDSSLLFFTDGRCKDASSVLSALGAKWDSDEHMMECSLRDLLPGTAFLPADPAGSSEPSRCVSEPSRCRLKPSGGLEPSRSFCEETGVLTYTSKAGSVRIAVYPGWYYLYDLEMLDDLAKREPLPIRLQVSSGNTAALRLYEKTGFRITETLSAWLYRPSVPVKP